MKIVVRKLHLWLGLATGLIVLIVSLTGAVFVGSMKGSTIRFI